MSEAEDYRLLRSAWESAEVVKGAWMTAIPDLSDMLSRFVATRDVIQSAMDEIRQADPTGHYAETTEAMQELGICRTHTDMVYETLKGFDMPSHDALVAVRNASDQMLALLERIR